MPELRTETMTVNMGPQHPSTHGVLRLVLELDGETIVSASPTIGYLHTGIEKTIEEKKWQQGIPLVERMDYLSAQSNSLAFSLSVERLLGLEMPERVRWIRVLLAELQGDQTWVVKKFAGPETTVEPVDLGEFGLWLQGGSHVLMWQFGHGDVRQAQTRLAGNVLLWLRNGTTYRLEGALDKGRMLEIARQITR